MRTRLLIALFRPRACRSRSARIRPAWPSTGWCSCRARARSIRRRASSPGSTSRRRPSRCSGTWEAILEAAGTDLSHVLRCGVFLVDMRDFATMNAVYARGFGDHRPARTTVAVSSLPHAGLRVEIDAVAA